MHTTIIMRSAVSPDEAARRLDQAFNLLLARLEETREDDSNLASDQASTKPARLFDSIKTGRVESSGGIKNGR